MQNDNEKLEIGDIVQCNIHPELGFGRVGCIWLTGCVDVTYPSGKVLINWYQKDFTRINDSI